MDVHEKLFEEPYVELFIWAILTNKQTLIDFCWVRCGQPILMAVVAAAIYSKLAHYYRGQKDYKNLQDSKFKFQEKANKLIELAFEVDQGKAFSLLEKRNIRWGDRNLMQIGYIGHLRKFIASKIFNVQNHTKYCMIFLYRPNLSKSCEYIVEKRIRKSAKICLSVRIVLPLHYLDTVGQNIGN